MLFIQIVNSTDTHLDQGELLFKGQVGISKQKEVMLLTEVSVKDA